jgi:membrane protease subunit HflK
LKRSQDRLRNLLPAGGRGNVSIVLIILVALLVLWLMKSVYTVQPDELGQEMVFGNPKSEVSSQGLHFIFWPIETVEKVPISVQREFIGTQDSRRNTTENNLMLSGDQNIVEINFSVLWRVGDPKKFLFNVSEPDAFLRRVAESAMRELVGRSSAEEVRTGRRAQVEDDVKKLVQTTLDNYDAGMTVVGVQLERADPPDEVADAFEEVQRAQQDLDRFQREADQYANKTLGDARGKAAQIGEQAIGYKQQVIAEAQGESKRFLSVLEQYQQARDVTRERLFLETMERILGNSNKIVLEPTGGQGVLPYLPLDRLQGNRPPAAGQAPTAAGQTQAPSLQASEPSP